ncbi:MAG: HD domain-containing protein, partial [Bacteroidia bacterium]|nr:HD domain-containing protein [Bacteroidia bacterium]
HHTFDVLKITRELCALENVSRKNSTLLKTAALFHDCGFTQVYDEHEAKGCEIAQEVLPGYQYSVEQINIICNLIMKTKLPQQPVTLLEKILCDADLYYLGSHHFYEVSERLYQEWIAIKKVSSKKEWNEAEVEFLEGHQYWTDSAKKTRGKIKGQHLIRLKQKLHQEF